ncbi:MAG: SRPBCC family protein [Notoacmeibacter sp.]|nr:SRPBCC family protein [Notoacmeibacter sp.]
MFTIEMTIARPVREVFAKLARVENAPLWYSAVTSVHRLDSGPVGVGTRFRFRRRLGSSDTINDVEVTAFEPDRTLELSSVSGPTPFVYHYELSPSPQGAQLQLDGTISGKGLTGPAMLLGPLAEKFFQRGMIDNLETLKRLIETGRA